MSNYNKSKSIFDQLEYYLQNKYRFRFNEISLNYEFSDIEEDKWSIANMDRLYIEIEKADVKISYDKLLIYLRGTTEKYNPLINYFKNELDEWDGYDYINQLANKIELNSDQVFFNQQFKKFLVRTVLCACEEKVINKNAIIFYSNKQNIGKSTFCRYLVPEALSEYFSENISNEKDSQIKLATNWLINLDEMQNFLSTDLEFIKALISKEMINERLPYEKKSQRITRRASFIGSTNKTNILKDHSNVRWLVFDINSFDFTYTDIDVNKVWSQARHYAYYEHDYNPFLSSDELNYNDEKNKKFRAFTREEEEIIALVEESENEKDFMTITALSIALRKVNVNKNPVTLGKLMNNIGFSYKRMGFERTKKYCVKLTGYYHSFLQS